MFEKLLSLVPYNPGMIHQLSFYSHRMKEEASIRRLGMVFLVMAFLVQSIAVITPPASAANCSNPNGNSMIGCGLSSIDDAHNACKEDRQGYMQFLHYYGISCSAFSGASNVTIHTDGQNYFSVGRQTSPGRDHVVTDVPENNPIYWRDLSTWGGQACSGSSAHNCWNAIRLQDQDGKTFYIIYDCGNLVSVGIPPHNQLRVETDTITVISGSGNVPSTPAPTPTAPAPTPTPTVPDTAPIPPEVPQTNIPVYPSVQVYPCKFNPTIDAGSAACPKPCATNASIPATSEQCYTPCQYNGSIHDTDVACKPCDKSTSQTDAVACVEVSKMATNVTQNIADANNTTANAGDVITYTLYAKNTGKAKIKEFTFQDNLTDILDYADLTDGHGGTLANDGVIAWHPQDIAAGTTASVQFTVKVKDPIPQTPANPNTPGRFDMIMTNVYGNSINIKLPAPPAKAVETVAATLPNTGPGTSIAIAAAIVIIGGYFYSRATLLARESDIAVKESASL
jgi:uncharacterized repeat protein (TIGR01451 family)